MSGSVKHKKEEKKEEKKEGVSKKEEKKGEKKEKSKKEEKKEKSKKEEKKEMSKKEEKSKKEGDKSKSKKDQGKKEEMKKILSLKTAQSQSTEEQLQTPPPPKFTVTREWMKKMAIEHYAMGATRMKYNPHQLLAFLEHIQPDFEKQPSLLEIESPIFVCGDIHGQLQDLRRIFFMCGFPRDKSYLFLGDYVDRGQHSMEVITLLLLLRQLYPKNLFMLRGNHELQHINKGYGFYESIIARFPQSEELAKRVYTQYNTIFSYIPLAAVIAQKILCMHGGLSPKLTSLDDIRKIERPIVQPKGLAQDILWADPEGGVCGFKPNALRACSFNFGQKDVEAMCKKLGVELVIRAHQVVERGYEFFADKRVITVFSASRYQDDIWNYAGVIFVSKNLEISIYQLKPYDFDEQKVKRQDDVTQDKDEEEDGTPKEKTLKSMRGKSERGKTCED